MVRQGIPVVSTAGMDGQTVPALPYDLAGGTGFGAAILAFTNAHPIFDGSASPADIGNIFAGARAGSFTLAQEVTVEQCKPLCRTSAALRERILSRLQTEMLRASI